MGSEGPQWGSVELICPSVCLSVSLSLCPVARVAFWRSFARLVIARSACVRRQNMSVHPSVRLSSRPWAFCDFCIYSFPVWWSSAAMHLFGALLHHEEMSKDYYLSVFANTTLCTFNLSKNLAEESQPLHFRFLLCPTMLVRKSNTVYIMHMHLAQVRQIFKVVTN